MITKDLFVRNRKKLTALIKPGAMAIICPAAIFPRNGNQPLGYRQSSNLLYLTGIQQEDTFLFICPDHPQKEFREVLFIRYTDAHTLVWEGPKLTKREASDISGVQTVLWTKDWMEFLKKSMKTVNHVFLEMGEEWLPEIAPVTLSYRFAKELKEQFPKKVFESIVPLISKLRTIKENEEIEIIKQAIETTSQTFRNILPLVKPNMYEYEIEAEITRSFIKNEHSGHAYLPIVAGGKNACALHYNLNQSVLQKGDLLLLDFGAERWGYCADLTRTIPVSGRFTKRQAEVYRSVLKIQRQAKKLMIPGNTIEKLNAEVGKIMEEEMVRLKLLKPAEIKKQEKDKPLYKKYYPHGISHFMGLDVHDCGTRELPFKKGMVLSCEPGIYIPEEGFGIRLENDILVDKTPMDLMENIPIEIEEIEKGMKR